MQCSTCFEGIMPLVSLMHVEVANILQRFGLKRGPLCLAPHFAGSRLFFFSFGGSVASQILTSLEGEWENAQADIDFEISDRTQGWKHLSIIHFRLWGRTGSINIFLLFLWLSCFNKSNVNWYFCPLLGESQNPGCLFLSVGYYCCVLKLHIDKKYIYVIYEYICNKV